jgi:hypothetical protein
MVFFLMVLAAFMRGYTHRHFLCHGKTCTQIQSSGGQVTSTVHGTVAELVVEVCIAASHMAVLVNQFLY